VAFLGDGGTNEGAFHESMNLASIWDLPVVFVVENNLYGEGTPLEFVTKVPDLAQRAEAYAMPAAVADGQDVVDTYEKAAPLVARARRGEGPSLLVCRTYRYSGHFVGDAGRYRPPEEVEEWRARDPILRFRARARDEGWLTEEEMAEIDRALEAELEEAVAFGASGPWPEDPERYVYVRPR
jgi:TPP-dependent pyruvate/acetoin dehydrogenase alpha subunit